jgi:hypothetical protein
MAMFILIFIFGVYCLPNMIYYMVYGGFHPNATDTGKLVSTTKLLHSIAWHSNENEPDGMGHSSKYKKYNARRILSPEQDPLVMQRPCREITKQELLAGMLVENYEIPLLLMRMCEVLHEIVGCDDAGFIIPKLLDTEDDLNVCIMTYKAPNGVCSHYINPLGRTALPDTGKGADMVSVTYDCPYYIYKGDQKEDLYTSYMVSYQPIVVEQIGHEDGGQDALTKLADTYKHIERAYVSGWLDVIPEKTTVVFGRPESFYYQMAQSMMLGTEKEQYNKH